MNEIQRDNLILACFTVVVLIVLLIIPNNHIPQTQTDYVSHTVKQGESISSIVASENGFVSERLIQKTQTENHIGSVIMPGEKLIIPISEGR